MLNPHQFEQYKVDLGDRMNRNHDYDSDMKARTESRVGPVPETGDAPAGYYNQPSSNIRQQALPGMEMSVQDHLDALGKSLGPGMGAKIESGKISHRISIRDLREPDSERYGGTERGHLSYSNERPEEGVRDNGDTVGVGHPEAKHPGEIRMVRSYVPGAAGKMLETAEKLATEHGYAFPKHSWDRTTKGVQWSQKQMRKRGEEVF